jgi:hypothetical protein
MKLKIAIPALAALALGASAASAQSVSGNINGTIGQGAAAAGRDGAIAGGLTAGGSAQVEKQHRKNNKRGDRGERSGQMERPQLGNSTSTYGAGAVYTDRNRSSAGVTSGASASGQGVQQAGTTVDAYGETTKQGSSADIYGDSVATSGERPRRR